MSSISDGSNLGVVANAGCDIGLVGYQTNLLLEKIGALLTPGAHRTAARPGPQPLKNERPSPVSNQEAP